MVATQLPARARRTQIRAASEGNRADSSVSRCARGGFAHYRLGYALRGEPKADEAIDAFPEAAMPRRDMSRVVPISVSAIEARQECSPLGPRAVYGDRGRRGSLRSRAGPVAADICSCAAECRSHAVLRRLAHISPPQPPVGVAPGSAGGRRQDGEASRQRRNLVMASGLLGVPACCYGASVQTRQQDKPASGNQWRVIFLRRS